MGELLFNENSPCRQFLESFSLCTKISLAVPWTLSSFKFYWAPSPKMLLFPSVSEKPSDCVEFKCNFLLKPQPDVCGLYIAGVFSFLFVFLLCYGLPIFDFAVRLSDLIIDLSRELKLILPCDSLKRSSPVWSARPLIMPVWTKYTFFLLASVAIFNDFLGLKRDVVFCSSFGFICSTSFSTALLLCFFIFW